MFDDNKWKLLNQQWDQQQAQSRAQTAQPQPQQQPQSNFLADLLPAGGGIGGALAGAAGGAALGSVVPGIGTVIGGLLGGVIGGAGGSAAGQFGKNVATGEQDLGKDVAKEAILGGVFSAPPIRLLRGAGALGKAGIGALRGGESALGQGVKETGKEAFERGFIGGPKTALDGSRLTTAGKLTDAGNRSLMSQYGTISSRFARSTDPKNTIGTLANAGIIKPIDAERVASAITGSDGIVTRAVSNAVGRAGGVSTKNLRQVFNDAVANAGLVQKDAESVARVFEAQLGKLAGGARGSLSVKANPTEVLGVMRSLEKRIAALTGKGDTFALPTPERLDQASVLKLVRDELEDQLYNAAGANKQLTGILTPEMRNELVSLMPGNKQWANYVDKNIIGAKTVGELRSSTSPFVRIGKIIDEGDRNAMTFGGRAGNAAGNVRSMAVGVIGDLVQGPVAQGSGRLLRAAGGGGRPPVPTGIGTKTFISPKSGIGEITTGQAPGMFARPSGALQAGGQLAFGSQNNQPSLEQSLMQQSPDQFGQQGQFGQDSFGGQDPSGQFGQDQFGQQQLDPYPKENLLYDIQRDPSNADKYIAYYQQIQSVFGQQGGGKDMTQTGITALAGFDNSLQNLDGVQKILNDNKGAFDPIKGRVSSLNPYDATASRINQATLIAAQNIGRSLEGGKLTDADIARYQAALPSITDTPAKAQEKIDYLRNQIQLQKQNYLALQQQFGGANVPSQNALQDAIMSQQGAF